MSKLIKITTKPCHVLGYCPYGPMVEDFPLHDGVSPEKWACKIFGHDCPVFTMAEGFTDGWAQREKMKPMEETCELTHIRKR